MNDAFIGAAARGASVVVMCPITTVKTRMEASHVGARQYRSVGDALATIVRTQGAGALVRGLPPLLLTNVPFAAIHYASYRRLQAWGRDYADGWTLNLVAGGLASTAATVATQPFDVVRTRLQACAAAGRPRTALNAVREIAQEGGAARLWRGTSAAALRVGGGAAIQFGSLRFLRTRSPPDAVNDAFIGAAARGACLLYTSPSPRD